jgi:hypothetical protein
VLTFLRSWEFLFPSPLATPDDVAKANGNFHLKIVFYILHQN